jgi:TolA-binding protein
MKLQDSLESAQLAGKRAFAASKAAEKEVAMLRKRLVEATVSSEEHVKELRNKLKLAENKANTAQNTVEQLNEELEQLSHRVAELEHAEMLSEQAGEEAAERDLAAVHAALSARDASIHDVSGRVMRAERDLEVLSHDLDQI